jgi:hypothetical protein
MAQQAAERARHPRPLIHSGLLQHLGDLCVVQAIAPLLSGHIYSLVV